MEGSTKAIASYSVHKPNQGNNPGSRTGIVTRLHCHQIHFPANVYNIHRSKMTPFSKDDRKKRKGRFRLSNPFGSKNHRVDNVPTESDQMNDSTLNVQPSDSAYGGSEPAGSTLTSSTHQVPTITESQAAAQNAPIKTQTEPSTGRTITTTTVRKLDFKIGKLR